MYPRNFLDLLDAFDVFFANKPYYTTSTQKTASQPKVSQVNHPKVFGYWCPEIKRVTFNGNTTIVWFTDDTYAIVNCSSGDKYDRKTAVAYAMVKRMLGKVGKLDKKTGKFNPKEVDSNGFGCYLQKIVDSAFDQEKEEKNALEKKRTAKAKHEAMQAAQKKRAFERRVEERAKQILLERAAMDRANQIEDDQIANNTTGCNSCSSCSKNSSYTSEQTYVKPNKPFSKFTQQEKREYWRAQNAKKRAKK